MQLSAKQVSDFDKDGYLIFRNLFSEQEVAILREEASRIAKLDTECVIREGVSGTPKSMFRMHETDGKRGSHRASAWNIFKGRA